MNNFSGYPRVIAPPSRVKSTGQRASRGELKVTLPVPSHKLRQLQPRPPTSIMEPINDPPTTLTPSDLYLTYAPTSRSSRLSQSQFFEKLGFRSERTSGDMRDKFIANMNDHVQHLSHKFLTKAANPEAFKILVAEFLAEYGPIYWGDSKRDHLKKQDIHQGFLCPRDALREDSRLVAVVEGLFNHRANTARRNDKKRATPLNRNLDFTALIGRKTNLIQPPEAVEPTPPNSSQRRRGPVVSDDEESNEPTHTQDGDQPGTNDSAAPSRHGAKRARPSHPPHKRETSEDSEAQEPPRASHAPHLTSTLNSPPEQIGSSLMNPVTVPNNSDDDEEQRNKRPKRSHSPQPTTLQNTTRAKNEDLSPDITSRIKLRVSADGPGVKDRGAILVDFEVYKTSQRLFTSLLSERNLKPGTREKVLELTVTIDGNKMCCRRDRLNDWSEVCRELRKLWDNRPQLFNDRFVMDVMLHVDD